MVIKLDRIEKIKQIINEIRPYLNLDGGDIEFIKYENKILYVKLTGNCSHCLMQSDTLNIGLLSLVQQEIPEILEIINVNL